jgi:hypothetical protein
MHADPRMVCAYACIMCEIVTVVRARVLVVYVCARAPVNVRMSRAHACIVCHHVGTRVCVYMIAHAVCEHKVRTFMHGEIHV